jgi:6-phosphogluconolactonase
MLELPGRVIVEADRDLLYDRLVGAMSAVAEEAIERRGVFHLALPGGSTPEPLYLHLVIDPRFRLFPWSQTHVWMTDERAVEPDDEQSNAKLLRESLLDHVTMGRRAFHAMAATSANGAEQYEAALKEEVGSDEPGAPPSLDFVLLGVGEDGHVASVFPGSPAATELHRWVATVGPEHATPPRMTLTLPLLSAARQVAILATGRRKAAILQRIARQQDLGPDPASLPVTGVRPAKRALSWYLDRDAAG